jgi:hypothetical protein
MYFLTFGRGDNKLIGCFNYFYSITTKITVVGLCLEEFIKQVPFFEKENEILEKEGFVQGVQSTLLVIKYETYLNSIYSLLENISYIVFMLYGNKYPLPRTFNTQKTRLLKDRTIDPGYSSILDSLTWYDEIRAIRAEFTHFLSGLLVYYSKDTPGYLIKPQSARGGTPPKIEVRDIISHAKALLSNLYGFLEQFGNHFLNLIDKDAKTLEICGVTYQGSVGCRLLSYNEMLRGEPGSCHTVDFDCPETTKCKARQKTSST